MHIDTALLGVGDALQEMHDGPVTERELIAEEFASDSLDDIDCAFDALPTVSPERARELDAIRHARRYARVA